jgi:hypothetical protein
LLMRVWRVSVETVRIVGKMEREDE